jgi:cold shock CspA family protein
MKRRKNIKKTVKKIGNSKVSKLDKKNKNKEVDLWKEIRTNFKPLLKAYNKFSEKRRITIEKEKEKKLKYDEKQRLRENEILRLQEQEENRLNREMKIKEEKERIEQAQIQQRLEEKRIKKEHDDQLRKEQIYREKLIKGNEERLNQIRRVKEARNEERELREQRYLDIESKFYEKRDPAEQKLKDEEKRLNEKEQRLKDEEQRLKDEEQRLKNKEQNFNENKKTNLNEGKRLKGTVLWFNDTKGYGFIKTEDGKKNIFVHFSALQNSGLTDLKVDEQLSFEVEHTDKGLSAVNLQKTVNERFHTHLKVIK